MSYPSYSEIKRIADEYIKTHSNYILITTEDQYNTSVNQQQVFIYFKCNCGKENKKRYDHYLKNVICKPCHSKEVVNSKVLFICKQCNQETTYAKYNVPVDSICKKCREIPDYYQDVVKLCDINNIKLLSTKEEYKHIQKKKLWVKFVCNGCKQEREKKYEYFMNDPICGSCKIKKTMTGKTTVNLYDEFVNKLKNDGYEMISPQERYINAMSYVEVKCPIGHTSDTTQNRWDSAEARCKKCDSLSRTKFEDVVNRFDDLDLVLITKKDEYINRKETMLKYVCVCGEIKEVARGTCMGDAWKGCVECMRNNVKISMDVVREAFINERCILLEDKYVNNHTPMNYICSCGGKGNTSFKRFKNGSKCQECKDERTVVTYEKVCMEKYGVRNAMQYSAIFQKNVSSGFLNLKNIYFQVVEKRMYKGMNIFVLIICYQKVYVKMIY